MATDARIRVELRRRHGLEIRESFCRALARIRSVPKDAPGPDETQLSRAKELSRSTKRELSKVDSQSRSHAVSIFDVVAQLHPWQATSAKLFICRAQKAHCFVVSRTWPENAESKAAPPVAFA
jgi:hypothetical protein